MTKTRKPITKGVLSALVKERGIQCEECKSNKFDDVDHIDEDPSNNILTNLRLLCGNCHRERHGWTITIRNDKVHVGLPRKYTPVIRGCTEWTCSEGDFLSNIFNRSEVAKDSGQILSVTITFS